jgi:hypothetical protein
MLLGRSTSICSMLVWPNVSSGWVEGLLRAGLCGAHAARFRNDRYSAFEEITRDGFAELIVAIERIGIDVAIIRDVLTP